METSNDRYNELRRTLIKTFAYDIAYGGRGNNAATVVTSNSSNTRSDRYSEINWRDWEIILNPRHQFKPVKKEFKDFL